MHILVIDRWRNVRIAPKKGIGDEPNKFAVLRELLKRVSGEANEGQIEFECDEEFLSALAAQSKATIAKDPKTTNVLGEDVLKRPTYNGVTIVVTDPNGAHVLTRDPDGVLRHHGVAVSLPES